MRLKAQIISLLLFLSVTRLVGQSAPVERNDFFSQALGQNIDYDIFFPPDYDLNTNVYYPVIYFLHGWAEFNGSLQEIADEAHQKMLDGDIDEAIIVCADNVVDPFDGSLYVNSSLYGDYEDFMVTDLIEHIENNYRVIPQKKYRALFGQSMGGFGAFHLAINHPDDFCVLSAHAAPLGLDVIIDDLRIAALAETSGPPYFFDYDLGYRFIKILFLGAGGFSPNSNTPQTHIDPPIVEYPIDSDGELIDSVFYDKWMDFEISDRIQSISSEDIGILFGCATNDQLKFYPGNIAFKDTLDLKGITYDYYEHSQGHPMPFGFLDYSLEFIDTHLFPPQFICNLPSNLTASNITTNGVDLHWTENGDAVIWQIRFGYNGFDTIGSTIYTTSSIPFQVDTLTSGASYDWYVRSLCSQGDSSIWVGPATFSTLCEPPSDLVAENITESEADISWTENGTATSWQIMIGELAVDSSMLKVETVTDNPFSIDTLEASTDYHFFVRADCGNGSFSQWVGPATFSTLCEPPTDLTAQNITESEVDITWTENGSATSWQIMIGELAVDSSILKVETVTSTSVLVDTLEASADYHFFVRADCGNGSFSQWVGPAAFSTHTVQIIDLLSGWNKHSFYVIPNNIDMLNMHQQLIDNNELVKISDEAGSAVIELPGIGWINGIGNMYPTEGYSINVNTNTQIELIGPLINTPYVIPLLAGWNIMGYPLSEAQNALEAVQTLIDNNELVKVSDEAGSAIIELPAIGWINGIGNFEPGEGYSINVNTNTSITLEYPSSSSIDPHPNIVIQEPRLLKRPFENNPYLPMNIFVTDIMISGYEINAGDEVGVFDNNRLVGYGIVQSDKTITSIIASKDDPLTQITDGFLNGNTISYKYFSTQQSTPVELFAHNISGKNEFSELGTFVCILSSNPNFINNDRSIEMSLNCYPNPAKDILKLNYTSPDTETAFEIFDNNGKRVLFFKQTNKSKSLDFNNISINLNSFKEGLYVIMMKTSKLDNPKYVIKKFIVKK